jgi:hypothetical protein
VYELRIAELTRTSVSGNLQHDSALCSIGKNALAVRPLFLASHCERTFTDGAAEMWVPHLHRRGGLKKTSHFTSNGENALLRLGWYFHASSQVKILSPLSVPPFCSPNIFLKDQTMQVIGL